MKRILLFSVIFLASPVRSFAIPTFNLITESDPGGPNNVVESSYNSLTDLVNLNPASTSPIFGFPSAVSISGLMFVPEPVNGAPEPPSLSLVVLGAVTALMMMRTRPRRTSRQS